MFSHEPERNTAFTRRRILSSLLLSAVIPLAGCSESTQDSTEETKNLEEFLSEHGKADARAGDNFSTAYTTVMETSVDQLTVQDLETARDQFDSARDDYDQLHSGAVKQAKDHEEGSKQAEIFDTLSGFYDLMTQAAASGYQGLDSLLEEEDIFDAFSRSASAFEMMEDTYDDALELRKEINLYRDTNGTTPATIVEDWIADTESDIRDSNRRFDEGSNAFSEREYSQARDAFDSARTGFEELLNTVNSEFAEKYPRESDLYQLYGDISYYFSRMRDAASALSNSSQLRADAQYQDAVEHEETAQEAHSEAIEGWERARENIPALDGEFELPSFPQLEAEKDPVQSRKDAETIVREWLEKHENEINAQSNYMSVAEEEYGEERFEDARDWYQSVAEDWGELATAAQDQADSYQHEFVVETFILLRDYFAALRNHAETMQQAASARAAGRDREATNLEEDANEYMNEAEDIADELDSRLPEED
jgi:HEPN domain-containing protein